MREMLSVGVKDSSTTFNSQRNEPGIDRHNTLVCCHPKKRAYDPRTLATGEGNLSFSARSGNRPAGGAPGRSLFSRRKPAPRSRVHARPHDLLGNAMKSAILTVDRAQPVYAIQPMTEILGQSVAQRRFP